MAALIALTGALLAYLAWRTGVTVDEPGHLIGAHLYWKGADRLPPGDMPPLIKLVSGWTLRRSSLSLPADLGKPGDVRREWESALTMMERIPPSRIQRVFFSARIPLIVFPLLSTLILWRWARDLFSPITAIVAAALFALEPTSLAHGAILKNDHAATFAYLLFWYAMWRYWRRASLANAAWIALATALCMLAKLSLLFVFGVAPILILLPHIKPFRAIALAHAVGAGALAYAIVLAAAQFQVHWLSDADLDKLAADRTIPEWFSRAAEAFEVLPVPAQMWAGTVSLMSGLGYEMPVYFLGQIWPHGHPLYFPIALLVKAPVSLIVLGFTGAVLLTIAIVRRRLTWADVLWIVPGPLYLFLASRVPIQLGVRLILPALPFGILLAAYCMEQVRGSRAGRVALAAMLALFVFESARIYPNGIAFFNLAAGGPGAGFRYLADSNLDWGQGLGDLARWTRAHRIPSIRLSYFGADAPLRYFDPTEFETIPPPWIDRFAKGPQLIPEPGHYYAISPTLLPGQFFVPKYRDYYARFRSMTPIARPGYSMFVYKP